MPLPFPEWRAAPGDRAEDAACTFAYHLIVRCRDQAMATLPADASPEVRAAVENAVDTALHNVTDLLEGFWNLDAGYDVDDERGERQDCNRPHSLRL